MGVLRDNDVPLRFVRGFANDENGKTFSVLHNALKGRTFWLNGEKNLLFYRS